jgi:hypothetical protein
MNARAFVVRNESDLGGYTCVIFALHIGTSAIVVCLGPYQSYACSIVSWNGLSS